MRATLCLAAVAAVAAVIARRLARPRPDADSPAARAGLYAPNAARAPWDRAVAAEVERRITAARTS